MGRKSIADASSTLTPLMFQILVSLSQGERHGYAIMSEIEERTGGEFNVGAGSLYRSVKQLVEAGLVVETDTEHSRNQRRYYRITPAGRRRASSAARVFRDIVAWADDASLLDTSG